MAKRSRKTSKNKDFGLGVFMNIKTDYAFKKVFFNKRLLISFLNSLGTLPEVIEDLEYLREEQLGYTKTVRKAFYDVYVKTTSGKRYVVEMQVTKQPHFAERMIFYACHAVISQGRKGKIITINKKGEEVKTDWDYNIDGVYMIAIVDFVMFSEDVAKDIFFEEVELMRRQVNLPFSPKFRFTIIELPKFRETLESLSTVKEKWIYLFRYLHTFRKRPEQMNEDIFEELFDDAETDNLTPNEMEQYKQSVKDYGDMISIARFNREEGIVIGIEKGRKEGRKEEQARMANRFRSQGKSIKEIAESMGLTEKQVYNLLE
jgi:predicted transposase/invertase (TIGR01784 family)